MDDFQRAAAAARRRYTEDAWAALPPREQASEIYVELRRIDAERVARTTVVPKRRSPSGTATAPSVGMKSAHAH